jgi:hypothetical protein
VGADMSAGSAAAVSGSAASSSTSSSMGQAKWTYLIEVQCSKEWTEAAAAFDSKWPDSLDVQQLEEPVDLGQLYADVLQLCKALAAAAPLPLVCNAPSCENLTGLSESAAAVKSCAGCCCRYCSAACQAADWRRHKKACKRMAAAAQACR